MKLLYEEILRYFSRNLGFLCLVVLVAQSCLTLCNLMDYSPPGSFVHEIFQARILECVAISFSRGSSQPRDRTRISCVSYIPAVTVTTMLLLLSRFSRVRLCATP